MTQIADKSCDLAKPTVCKSYEILDRVIQYELPLPKIQQDEMHIKSCKKLKEELDAYCRQLPRISFNGS